MSPPYSIKHVGAGKPGALCPWECRLDFSETGSKNDLHSWYYFYGLAGANPIPLQAALSSVSGGRWVPVPGGVLILNEQGVAQFHVLLSNALACYCLMH